MLIVISVIIARIERDNRYEKMEHRVSTQEIMIGNRPASLSFMCVCVFFFFFLGKAGQFWPTVTIKRKKSWKFIIHFGS